MGQALKYDTNAMREAASRISTSANAALTSHETTWHQILASVQRLPGFLQGPIMAILTPHDQRFRSAYQWQLDTASWLLSKAEQIEIMEKLLG